MKRLMLIPYTFVLMNWAAVAGLYHVLCGTEDIWFPYRHANNACELPPCGKAVPLEAPGCLDVLKQQALISESVRSSN